MQVHPNELKQTTADSVLLSESMAITATCIDETQTVHLVIGLNRRNLEALLRGETVTFPAGSVPLAADADIAVVFGETDEQLVEERLSAPLNMPSPTVQ